MSSKAKTVQDYINNLPDDRKFAILEVRNIILNNLPKGIEEVVNWGMITYQIPLELYPNTYNRRPLMFAALASQKNHMSVYLSAVYSDIKLREEFVQAYKKLVKELTSEKAA